MITQCPHCQEDLNFNESQQEKLQKALVTSKTGTVKLGCPQCKQVIQLTADNSKPAESSKPVAPPPTSNKNDSLPKPPQHPDISWIATGIYEKQETVANIPKVLIMIPEGATRDCAIKAFTDQGYQAELPESAADAIEQMRFVDFKAVILHAEFDPPLSDSKFYQHMKTMPMAKRRSIYYLLIGTEFHTLYDLEALAHSANAVANDTEAKHLDIILKKGLKDFEKLFAPYINSGG